MSPRQLATALALCASLVSACRDEPPPPQRVENPGLGIAVAAVPAPFAVVSHEGDTIVLVAPGPAGDGRAVIASGPVSEVGINLVEAVTQRREWYETTPGAIYLGNRELGTPIGTAFTARGTYPVDGSVIEETKVFAVHPVENRLLSVTFTYPTGESQTRIEQLMALVGEIEGLPATTGSGNG